MSLTFIWNICHWGNSTIQTDNFNQRHHKEKASTLSDEILRSVPIKDQTCREVTPVVQSSLLISMCSVINQIKANSKLVYITGC